MAATDRTMYEVIRMARVCPVTVMPCAVCVRVYTSMLEYGESLFIK